MILVISLFVVEVVSGFCLGCLFSLHLIVEESRRQPFPSPLSSPAVVVESLQIVTRLCVERKMWLENGDVAGSSVKRWFLKQPIYSYLYINYILDSAILI